MGIGTIFTNSSPQGEHRSKDYLNRVEEFLEGYDPNKKEMDLETKKLILNLLFKNIKIAHKKLFSFDFLPPKHALSEVLSLPKDEVEWSLSGLSDGLLFRLYNTLYSFFKIQEA